MMEINKDRVIQIGILVKDAEKAAEKWSKYLGVEVPPINVCNGPEITGAVYKGKACQGIMKQVCFDIGNTQIELIQPIGDEPSVWKDALEERGEGLHHIAIAVKDIDDCVQEFENDGMKCIQSGKWVEDKGGAYAYMDAMNSMAVIIELLENY